MIGQACEFDYSGTQAIKALKAEGIEVVLVNSNPATIMTDPELADRTYVEPINLWALERILERERPDAVLTTLGGQTALNLAVEASEAGLFDRFPILAERRSLPAGDLSGGEQMMLAIGRALMSRPRVLLLDEPSLGLAPQMVDTVQDVLLTLKRDGMTILLVEQNAHLALSVADRAYVLETGRVALSGPAAELARDDAVRRAYLGAAAAPA